MYIHSSEHNKDRGTIKWTLPHLKSDFHYMQAIKKLSGLWWWNHFLTEYWCKVISSAHAFTYRGFQLHILPVHSITLMLRLCQSYVGKSGSLADTYSGYQRLCRSCLLLVLFWTGGDASLSTQNSRNPQAVCTACMVIYQSQLQCCAAISPRCGLSKQRLLLLLCCCWSIPYQKCSVDWAFAEHMRQLRHSMAHIKHAQQTYDHRASMQCKYLHMTIDYPIKASTKSKKRTDTSCVLPWCCIPISHLN